MRAPSTVVRQWAEFWSSLPTDSVWDGNELIQVGGRTVAEEIGQILVRLGCRVEAPTYAGYRGWAFNFSAANRTLYCQATHVGHFLLNIEDKPFLGWLRRRPNLAYWNLLSGLADELDRDPRFWDIVWHTAETVMSGEAGATRPVGDQPPLTIDFELPSPPSDA